MKFFNTFRFHTCALLLLAFLFAAGTYAQEGDSTAKKKRRGPLPFYYGKLGVSDAQREKLYDIQDSYEDKLKALRMEIKKLLAERETAMQETLTPGQKLRLQELKAEAEKKAPAGKKPAKKTDSEN